MKDTQRVHYGCITGEYRYSALHWDLLSKGTCSAWPGSCEVILPIALVGAAANVFLGESSHTMAKSPMISSDRSDITKSISCKHAIKTIRHAIDGPHDLMPIWVSLVVQAGNLWS